jgi:ATP-binding cassette subfamily B protein
MRLLSSYLRRYRGHLCLGLVFAAIAQLSQLMDPLIARRVIDNYVLRPGDYSRGQFLRGAGLLIAASLGLGIVSRLAKNLQDYFVSVVTQRVGADLYSDGVRHSLELPYALFEDRRSGETLGKLQKVRADTEKLIATAVGPLFTMLIAVVFVTAYAFTVHWSIVPLMLAIVVMLGGVSSVLSRRIKTIQQVIVAQTSALAGAATESLRNIELVKSLGLASQEIRRLNATTDDIVRLELRKVRTVRSLGFIHGCCIVLARTTIFFTVVYLVFRGAVTPGQWFSLSIYLFHFIGPLHEIGTVINAVREAEASLDRFAEILASPIEEGPSDPTPLGTLRGIVFEGVGFTYATATAPSLSDISFQARRGETIAFVGPSGSGKTTLVKLLVGLYAPQQGCILYNGISGTTIDRAELRAQIGLVAQETQLFSGSIRDNLLFVHPGATDTECLAVLKQAACDCLLTAAGRDGLDTLIGEGGVKVSGGEKQRLSIARALLRRPHLLVFDEATSSLDSLTEEEVTTTVRRVASTNVVTILISHRLSTVRHADTTYVLERGRIVEVGRHEDLLARKGLYYAMWRQQVGERLSADDLNGASIAPFSSVGSV